jgi:hypothetical protein
MKPFPSRDEILSRLHYIEETGEFIWKKLCSGVNYEKSWNVRFEGKTAGTLHINNRGKHYWRISINHRVLNVHHIVWFLHHGRWPKELDHEDGNGLNNVITNLKEVSRMQNSRNSRLRSTNTSGATGVRWDPRRGKWSARIMVAYKEKWLGEFDIILDAVAARKRAERQYGFHPNHGSDRPL